MIHVQVYNLYMYQQTISKEYCNVQKAIFTNRPLRNSLDQSAMENLNPEPSFVLNQGMKNMIISFLSVPSSFICEHYKTSNKIFYRTIFFDTCKKLWRNFAAFGNRSNIQAAIIFKTGCTR